MLEVELRGLLKTWQEAPNDPLTCFALADLYEEHGNMAKSRAYRTLGSGQAMIIRDIRRPETSCVAWDICAKVEVVPETERARTSLFTAEKVKNFWTPEGTEPYIDALLPFAPFYRDSDNSFEKVFRILVHWCSHADD